jgi:hypothetical protein
MRIQFNNCVIPKHSAKQQAAAFNTDSVNAVTITKLQQYNIALPINHTFALTNGN